MDGSQAADAPRAEILLTGVTGFLGKVVLHELVRRREELGLDRVQLVVRPKRGTPAASRFRQLTRSPALASARDWLREHAVLVEADLAGEEDALADASLAQQLEGVTHVIHCAASVEFNLPVREALAANVTSALRVQALANRLPRVVALASVSTAYVHPHAGDHVAVFERLAPLPLEAEGLRGAIAAGAHDGAEPEGRLLASSGHPNTYTLTKSLAEHLIAARLRVPTTLVRPSIIAGSLRQPFPGWIDSPAAFALFAMMVGSGRMRAVIAGPQSLLDLVPVDEVATRAIDAAFSPPPPAVLRIRHAVVGPDRSPSLALCRERILAYFSRHPVSEPGAGRPGVPYLGPDGLRYALHDALHHRLPRRLRPIASRIVETQRRFAYFTQNTFRFETAEPAGGDGFEPSAYLDLACAGVHRHLLAGDVRDVPLGGIGHPGGSDLLWAVRQPKGSPLIRLTGLLVAKALRKMKAQVTIDLASFEAALAQRPADAVLVLAPTHRSMLDFVLVSYLSFARPDLGIDLPAVAAAGDFARLPVLGRVLRGLGAFYIERGVGREDKTVTEEVHRLVREGRSLELFVEGQRSRSRRFLPPRRGLLRSLQATGIPTFLLPIAISYDHVPEEGAFEGELRGAKRAPLRVRDFLAWTGRLRRGEIELGRVHLACGTPALLDLRGDVSSAARGVVEALRAASVVTTHSLEEFVARRPEAGVDVASLVRALRARGVRVLASAPREAAVGQSIERCLRETWRSAFLADLVAAFPQHPVVSFATADESLPDAAQDVPGGEAFLLALFAEATQDWRAVGAAAAAATEGGEGALVAASPAALTLSIPDAHLPDVEDAVADLLARGILVRGEPDANLRLGPRVADLGEWRSRLDVVGEAANAS